MNDDVLEQLSVHLDDIISRVNDLEETKKQISSISNACVQSISSTSTISNQNPYFSYYSTTPGYWTTTSTNWNDLTTSSWLESERKVNCLESIIYFCEEKELNIILNSLKTKDPDEFKSFVRLIVEKRHMSEQFLVDNFEFLEKSIIEIHHKAEIKSGAYPALTLLFNL